MTTIVIDRRRKIMVSDNQNTLDGIPTPCRKIFRMESGPNKGTLVGTVGAPGPCLIFMHWYKHHAEHDFAEVMDDNAILGIDLPEDDFWIVLLTPDNKIMIVDRFFCPEEVPTQYHAVGSGGNIALGALDHGATAEEAIRTACRRDTYTSLMNRPMQVEEL